MIILKYEFVSTLIMPYSAFFFPFHFQIVRKRIEMCAKHIERERDSVHEMLYAISRREKISTNTKISNSINTAQRTGYYQRKITVFAHTHWENTEANI